MIGSQKNSYGISLSLREWLVCIFATLTLVFTAWSLGGYKTWALHLLFAGGMGTFLASVLPMPRSWNGYDQQHGNLRNFKRLLLQPFFWTGLFFLVYILIQYFNPSVVQVFGEKSWWVERMTPPLGANLPSSVKADYETMNALRTFVIQASAISLACGILVGIQRRKSALIILWSFVTSGVVMGFIAILQKLSSTDKILWIVGVVNKHSWGTFAYRNQAAAFLILVIIISCLLYFYYLKKPNVLSAKGGPHLLCLLYIFILFSSIWLALSRGGIIIGCVLVLAFLILALLKNIFHWRTYRDCGPLLLFIAILFGGGIFILQLSDWGSIEKRKEHLKEIIADIGVYDRTLSSKATWEMAQDRLSFGWGAGSFRYVFPIYQKEHKKIWYHAKWKKKGWQGRRIYNYAHNDWLQFLAEYGVLGCCFLGGIFLCLVLSAAKLFAFNKSAGCLILIGIILVFVHNFVDFIFSSPAYWSGFLGSLFLIIKLFDLEENFLDTGKKYGLTKTL
jgi:O-antigen ligase